MAMLDRYKKTGGFNQLLTLLETCGAQKQLKFLEIIRQEDPRWADALLAKLIDLQRFLTWNDSVIAEVTGAMLDINVAAIISSLPEAEGARLMGTLAHLKRKKVIDLVEATKPTGNEIATSLNKLYETIRKLTADGVLRLDKIDRDLFVDVDIEDRLKQGKSIVGVLSAADSLAKMVASSPALAERDSASSDAPHLSIVTSIDPPTQSFHIDSRDSSVYEQENLLLKKRVQLLGQENQALRQEVANMQARLDQIKKFA